ncbi:MAG TPA: phytanoyl-CoA dioxygenase family protein [Chloroflexota bacterium]|nr:phytanoyl-CoA dioxygenase family protein [Chloroflexota bacterium]
MVARAQQLLTLTEEQKAFFEENGFLRLERVFSPDEIGVLGSDLEYIMQVWTTPGRGWEGPWRQKYLTADQEQKAQLSALHELECYSAAWSRAIFQPRLVDAVADLIGPEVEFHHATLHAKAPEYGTPFPMHQDHPFYPHENGLYVDALIHVDAATEENGCLKFLRGSHKLGALEHVKVGSPHLPPEQYRLEDAVSCPASAGDVILFSIHTIHGSALNGTAEWRRLVRVGYRNPRNRQTGGQAMGRPGTMVRGVRPKVDGVTISPYGNWTQPPKAN